MQLSIMLPYSRVSKLQIRNIITLHDDKKTNPRESG